MLHKLHLLNLFFLCANCKGKCPSYTVVIAEIMNKVFIKEEPSIVYYKMCVKPTKIYSTYFHTDKFQVFLHVIVTGKR